jgi:hypothetical protein
MSLGLDFRFHAERTPNPQSLKWVLSKQITPPGVTASFQTPVDADVSPLAARLFAIADVVGVFLAPGFVTVTKREGREWTDLAQPIVDALKAFAAAGESALGPAFSKQERPDESGVVARIKEILENEVRPAVARDGGDVVFAGYRDGSRAARRVRRLSQLDSHTALRYRGTSSRRDSGGRPSRGDLRKASRASPPFA